MTVKKYVSEDNKEVSLAIEGKFDFSLHQLFRDAYVSCEEIGVLYTLELSNTSYMDSSALGMILLLKDHADKHKSRVVINKPNQVVNKILEIAQFHRLFTIES